MVLRPAQGAGRARPSGDGLRRLLASRARSSRRARLFPAPDYDLRLYPFPTGGGLASKWQTLRRPYSYMFGPDFRRDLDAELARGFDVLHLEQLWSGWLGLDHADRALVNVHHLVWIDLEESRPKTLARGRLDRRLLVRHRADG